MPSTLPFRMASFGRTFLTCVSSHASAARVRCALEAAYKRWPNGLLVIDETHAGDKCMRFVVPRTGAEPKDGFCLLLIEETPRPRSLH